MKDRFIANYVATNNPSGQLTSGFAKVRQSEIVFEYFSEIVYCRTCRKAAARYVQAADSGAGQDNKTRKLKFKQKYQLSERD